MVKPNQWENVYCWNKMNAANRRTHIKQDVRLEGRGVRKTLQATKKRDKEGGKRHERPLVKLFQIVRQCNP